MAIWARVKSGAANVGRIIVVRPITAIYRQFKNDSKDRMQTAGEFYQVYIEAADEFLTRKLTLSEADLARFTHPAVNTAISAVPGYENSVKTSLTGKLTHPQSAVTFTLEEAECLVATLFRPESLTNQNLQAGRAHIVSALLAEGTEKSFAILVGLDRKRLLNRAEVHNIIANQAATFDTQLLTIVTNREFVTSLFAPGANRAELINTRFPTNDAVEDSLREIELGLTRLNNVVVTSGLTNLQTALAGTADGAVAVARIVQKVSTIVGTFPSSPETSAREAVTEWIKGERDTYAKTVTDAMAEVKALAYHQRATLTRILQTETFNVHCLEYLRALLVAEAKFRADSGRITGAARAMLDRGPARLVTVAGGWMWRHKLVALQVALLATAIHIIFGSSESWYVPQRFKPTPQEKLAKLVEEEASGEELTKEKQAQKKALLEALFRSVVIPATIRTERELLVSQIEGLATTKTLLAPNAAYLKENPGVFSWLRSMKYWGHLENDSKLMNTVVAAVQETANELRDEGSGKSPLEMYMDTKFKEGITKNLTVEHDSGGKILAESMTALERRIESIIRNQLDTKLVLPTNIYSTDNTTYINSHPEVFIWLNRLFRASLLDDKLAAFIVPENNRTIDELITMIRTTVDNDKALLDAIAAMSADLSNPLAKGSTPDEVQKLKLEEKLRMLIEALEEKAGVKLKGEKQTVAPMVTEFDRRSYKDKSAQLAELRKEKESLEHERQSLEQQRMEVLETLKALPDNNQEKDEYVAKLGPIDKQREDIRTRLGEIGSGLTILEGEVKVLGEAIEKADQATKSLGEEGKGLSPSAPLVEPPTRTDPPKKQRVKKTPRSG